MNCSSARRLMLEADPSELTPRPDTDLGAHLATCAACRGAAAEILSLETGLADWLAAKAPRADGSAAIARAATTARRRRAVRRAGGTLALAAAAVLATILALPSRPVSGPLRPPPPAVAARGFTITTPPGREVVVLQPKDPDIVVVWFLPYRRSS